MPPVWCTTTFKGEKGEFKTEALLNSGSDVVILPRKLAREIGPTLAGTGVFELADGRTIRRKIYEIEVEVINEEKNEIRNSKTYATIEKRDYPLLGTDAMRKLKIIPDVVRGKVLFV